MNIAFVMLVKSCGPSSVSMKPCYSLETSGIAKPFETLEPILNHDVKPLKTMTTWWSLDVLRKTRWNGSGAALRQIHGTLELRVARQNPRASQDPNVRAKLD